MKTLYDIIIRPILTEKSMIAVEKNNCYVFEVSSESDKTSVKKAIEKAFNVKVKKVNLLNTFAKKKIFRNREGSRGSFKKAYVTLSPESKIELNSNV